MSINNSFPVLPVLSNLQHRAEKISGLVWSDISVVAVQHLLESTGSLLNVLITLGIPSNQIHILGKHYSSNYEVINALRLQGINVYNSTDLHPPGQFSKTFKYDVLSMWANVENSFIKKRPSLIIVLDDGGRCLENIPDSIIRYSRVIAIEQTTSGISDTENNADVILVATSAAKTILEPPLISRTIFDKARGYLPEHSELVNCGVIGIGNIGKSVANGLIAEGYNVYVTDKNTALTKSIQNTHWCEDANSVVNSAEYIFGCTGKDVFLDTECITAFRGKKTLLSVSSEDIEFNSLLKLLPQQNIYSPRQDMDVQLPEAVLRIAKGGFPVNFNGSRISVTSDAIQLTRGLLLCGVIQAAFLYKMQIQSNSLSKIMLDPLLQKFVVKEWMSVYCHSNSIPIEIVENFQNLDWITANSQGDIVPIDSLFYYFA